MKKIGFIIIRVPIPEEKEYIHVPIPLWNRFLKKDLILVVVPLIIRV